MSIALLRNVKCTDKNGHDWHNLGVETYDEPNNIHHSAVCQKCLLIRKWTYTMTSNSYDKRNYTDVPKMTKKIKVNAKYGESNMGIQKLKVYRVFVNCDKKVRVKVADEIHNQMKKMYNEKKNTNDAPFRWSLMGNDSGIFVESLNESDVLKLYDVLKGIL